MAITGFVISFPSPIYRGPGHASSREIYRTACMAAYDDGKHILLMMTALDGDVSA
jgi:hypothetical protein